MCLDVVGGGGGMCLDVIGECTEYNSSSQQAEISSLNGSKV